MMADPSRLVQAQLSLWNDYLTLWQRTAQRFLGGETEPMIEPSAGDRRFRDAAWTENTLFDFIKQSYLLTARWMQSTVRGVEGNRRAHRPQGGFLYAAVRRRARAV